VEKIKVTTGLYWVDIPEVNLYVMCGSPADSVKHLMKRGLIIPKQKDGVAFESGPNAILLSDVSVQNGSFSNLAEFPVLQMFYRQGMLLPKHPNNTGRKPMLIGIAEQVKAQSHYIYRGNYGLTSVEEIVKTGISEKVAQEMMRLKLRFAFDKIMETEELLDTRIVDKEAIEIRDGVFIHRKGFNIYEFMYNGESVTVDLGLTGNEEYEPAYHLGFHKIRREYFSIVHTGEGDGWDVNRPCMASIIIFQGRIFLIDAGPNMLNSLTALGISVNEIEGIFHTHAHDDHFAGLTTLVRADHQIKYFATPLVRASVVKKLSALMSMDEDRFSKYFDVHDLEFDKWNNIEGLEVKPLFSPHPVETSIMLFRAIGEGGYKTYAHWADTVSLDVLDKMVTDDPAKSGVTREFFNRVKKQYLIPVNLKKIDIGGGLIHGRAEDFLQHTSDKILLSHTALPLTDAQKEIGSNTSFGMQDILIPAQQNYIRQHALRNMRTYFPKAPQYELEMLINCPEVSFNAGSILIKKGVVNKHIYLILSGVLEFIDSEHNVKNLMSAGTLAGELSATLGEASQGTYRAASYVHTIRIPNEIYIEFVKRNYFYEDMKQVHENRHFLRSTWLFGDMVSYPIQNRIAQQLEAIECAAGKILPMNGKPGLFLLAEGHMQIFAENKLIEPMSPGDFAGEETILFDIPLLFRARALSNAKLFIIPGERISGIPVVQWKMLETFDRRMRMLNTQFNFEWRKEYTICVKELDDQHKELFLLVSELCGATDCDGAKEIFKEKIHNLRDHVKLHFDNEEALLKKHNYPELETQQREHNKLTEELSGFIGRVEHGEVTDRMECVEFLKNWFITHTLVEDRKYGVFFNHKGVH
jgi:hemerythrin